MKAPGIEAALQQGCQGAGERPQRMMTTPLGPAGSDCGDDCDLRGACLLVVDRVPRMVVVDFDLHCTHGDGRVVFGCWPVLGGGIVVPQGGRGLGKGLDDGLGSGVGLDGAFADSFDLPQVHCGSCCYQAGSSIESSASCIQIG